MTGTNKLVLLLVLIDLAAEGRQEDAQIPIEELTDRYVASHWEFGHSFRGVQLRHSRVNKKRKDDTYATDSTAMQHIYKLRGLLEEYGLHPFLNVSFDSLVYSTKNLSPLLNVLDDLHENAKKDLWRNPVHRLQKIPSTEEPFLFTIDGEEVKFLPGVADALTASSEKLKAMIRTKLAKMVTEYNRATIGNVHWTVIYDHIFHNVPVQTQSTDSKNDVKFSIKYPWLSQLSGEPIDYEIFDTRARNVLKRRNYTCWGDFAPLTDAALYRMNNIGRLTVARINEALEGFAPPITLNPTMDVIYDVPDISTDVGGQHPGARIAIEWVSAINDECTLNSLINSFRSGLDVPQDVVEAVEAMLSAPLSELFGHSISSLGNLIEELVAEAKDPRLLMAREFSNNRPTLEELGDERGLTRERIRQIVANDAKVVREAVADERFRTVRWALDHLKSSLGLVVPAEHDSVHRWKARLGEQRFETLRWLADYTYEDDWLVRGKEARTRLKRNIAKTVGGEWLINAEHISESLDCSVLPDVAVHFMLDSGDWRDIGMGWLVRWDGPIQNKAQRVLRLTCRPMTPEELIEAIGHGTVASLKNQRGSALVRVDKEFRLALPEWGFEEYEGITTEIEQRIDRGGGVASVSAMLEEFVTSFGVKEGSVRAYLETGPYIISGDEVRRLTDLSYTPSSVSGLQHAARVGDNWGQRFTVSDDNLRGYSFGLDRDIAAHNGLQPEDSLLVPATHGGTAVGEASLIWRLTNISGTVDIGRLSSVLKRLQIDEGDEIVIVATPESCAVLRANETPQQQPHQSAVSDDIRHSLLGRK